MTPRVVICYVTAGAGHRRAAQAIDEALRRARPDFEVACIDALDWTPAWWRRRYPAVYEWLVRHAPALWAAGYHLIDHPIGFALLGRFARSQLNQWLGRELVRWIAGQSPSLIVATHFFPVDVLVRARRAGQLQAPVVSVITDTFPHRLWLTPGADAVVVNSELTARLCRERGVPAERIHPLGIPVERRFRELADRQTVVNLLGLYPERRTILILGGGMGVGPVEQVVEALLAMPVAQQRRLQLLVVCGQNRGLQDRLQRRALRSPVPLIAYGFVETIPQLMRASDLVITKAGGLTVTEALAAGVPMIFCGNIPGQEQVNAEYVVEHEAGLHARHAREAAALAVSVLADPVRLEAMRQAAQRLGHPEAASAIVERVLLPLMRTVRA